MARNRGYIIAIDGPAGAGKSTVSQMLARELLGRRLDTGAMYRAVGYFALKKKADNPKAYGQVASSLRFSIDRSGNKVLVNGKDLGQKIRTEKVSAMASYVSKFRPVREALTEQQRKLGALMAKKFAVVVEGRDIGTVVFPNAEFKFFITASLKERAKRRYLQLKHAGGSPTLKEIIKNQAARDRQDSERDLAPLKKAKGALLINTSKLSSAEVVQRMLREINRD